MVGQTSKGLCTNNVRRAGMNKFQHFAGQEPTFPGLITDGNNWLSVGYQIINGYDDNTFKPGTTITRAELAEMLYKAIKEKENQAELAE